MASTFVNAHIPYYLLDILPSPRCTFRSTDGLYFCSLTQPPTHRVFVGPQLNYPHTEWGDLLTEFVTLLSPGILELERITRSERMIIH